MFESKMRKIIVIWVPSSSRFEVYLKMYGANPSACRNYRNYGYNDYHKLRDFI